MIPEIHRETATKIMPRPGNAWCGNRSSAQGIKDRRVIEAMLKIPRHLFVPEALVGQAYADSALPIGEKQTITQPFMVAFMSAGLESEGPGTSPGNWNRFRVSGGGLILPCRRGCIPSRGFAPFWNGREKPWIRFTAAMCSPGFSMDPTAGRKKALLTRSSLPQELLRFRKSWSSSSRLEASW